MNPPIGFVLVTHSNPAQILFLCEQLTRLFDGAPIVVHHDFSKTDVNTGLFPKNVSFVKDWVQTKWGGWGIVEGQMRATRELYARHNPDWFVVLSGADFPVKTANAILEELYGGGFNAYLYHRRIGRCLLPMPPEGFGAENYVHPAWERLAFERYVAIGFGFYKLATRLKWRTKALYLRQQMFIRRLTPFDGTVECYAGDFWLTGDRATAEALLDDSEVNRRLIAHFKRRPVPDEGFLHTVLGNVKALKISEDNKRFTDWVGQVNHPRTLTAADFPRLLASGSHFARKFEFRPDDLLRLSSMLSPEAGANFAPEGAAVRFETP